MKLGVILGTGAEDLDLSDLPVEVINRFGVEHKMSPSQVDYVGNAKHLKSKGCTHVLCSTAVGSYHRGFRPGDIALPSDFIDFTHRNTSPFKDFSNGMKHTYMGEALYSEERKDLYRGLEEEFNVHGGTIVTIEGPRFTTRAESMMFSNLADFINMTTSSEVVPIIELGMIPIVIGIITDYDTCLESGPKEFTKELVDSFEIPRKVRSAVEILLGKNNIQIGVSNINNKGIKYVKN